MIREIPQCSQSFAKQECLYSLVSLRIRFQALHERRQLPKQPANLDWAGRSSVGLAATHEDDRGRNIPFSRENHPIIPFQRAIGAVD